MKNNVYMPFNFDFKYEYKTYKNIGKEYKIKYKAEKNVLYRLYWFIRKIFNWNEKKYKDLNNFSEWEEYVNQTRSGDTSNKKDFIHFLEGKARGCDVNRNTIGSIVTPIYVILISGGLSILLLLVPKSDIYESVSYAWCTFSVILFLILVFLLSYNHSKSNQYFFCKDYIEIIKKQ